jgi:hypothetical protein
MRRSSRYLLAIAVIFIISRLLGWAAGIYDFSGPLMPPYYVAPPYLLQHRLVETLFYLHLQPPLYNLFFGLALKIFAPSAKAGYLLVSHALGLFLCLGLFSLQVRLKTPLLLAFALTALFALSPGAMLYEHSISYTFISGVFLFFAAVFLHRYAAGGKTRDAAVYFTLLAALVLTRTTFHIIWFGGAAAIPFFAQAAGRRRLVRALALPCLVVAGWHVQQLALFGYPFHSYTLGKQLILMALHEMPDETLRGIARAHPGVLSDAPSIYTPGPDQLPAPWRNLPPTGIPALDWKYKHHTDERDPNFNYIGYIYYGRQCQSDAVKIIRLAPEYFARAVAYSVRDYFRPSQDLFCDDWEYPLPISGRIYDLFYGRFAPRQPVLVPTARGERMVDDRRAWFVIFGLPFLFIYGLAAAIRRRASDKPFALTVAFMVGSIAWITAVVFTLTLGESMRYRSKIDPFFVALLGVFIADMIGAGRRKLGAQARE